jgi:Arc/MetJ family transcription regulator
VWQRNPIQQANTLRSQFWAYDRVVSRTNIEINDALIQKARKLTRLRTKRAIVDRALELLVRTESRKGILHYYGSGIWEGDLKAARRNRV